MQIFQAEIDDGVAGMVHANASVSYASVIEPSEKTNHDVGHIKALAAMNDSDLYYVQSILVSSSWNKNDDIFDKAEVWAAKNTPEDKPTNLNHDENIIIGHITQNWPITDDGQLIDPETPIDQLPDKFHILTGSVIYKSYMAEELKERTSALIAEIENGTKYVSMECFFKGFDYGLLDKSNGTYKILARNDDTAHLTKYLRAYGGLGEHENYKIGRVLRQITFSGKGFVDKPANPDSIIFNSLVNNLKKEEALEKSDSELLDNNQQKNDFSQNSGVFASETVNTTEKIQMSEESNNLSELEASVQAKEAELAQALSSFSDCQSEAAKKDEMMKKKEEEMMKMKAELDAANETIAAYKMKEEEMMKKEKKAKRMASLVDAGVETTEAEAAVEKFDAIDDAAFDAMTILLAAKKPKMTEEKKVESAEQQVTEEVLETVEEDSSAVDLTVGGSDETQIESTRAALVDFVYSRLGKKLNKGE